MKQAESDYYSFLDFIKLKPLTLDDAKYIIEEAFQATDIKINTEMEQRELQFDCRQDGEVVHQRLNMIECYKLKEAFAIFLRALFDE